jgi:two-component system nitrogen regulation sensor histidine kinase NtrY
MFSLFIFNYGIQKYFDNQITNAVNNSYDIAKNYLKENKKNVQADAIMMSVGLNRASRLFYSNTNQYQRIIKAEKILRRIDDVYLMDSSGNILFSDISNIDERFEIPSEDDFNEALKGNVIFLTNNSENKTIAMIKLNTLVDTYLYISRDIDQKILKYLNETKQAVNFYYSVENSQTGIKITFAIIYIILVTLLLFISIVLAISFANKLTKPIINLIEASANISKGALDTKVLEIEADDEFKMLNKNFNSMIDRLKKQQDKLLITEKYEAWEAVARKLAHEIKNPLTPIQLSIDRLREKYSKKISGESSEFENYLQTINRQIKDIEKLANEFSNFARMPRPIFKKNDIFNTIERSVNFSKMSSKNMIVLKNNCKKGNNINGDDQQLYRVFINLIKNSEESFEEKIHKKPNFEGKIHIEIDNNDENIIINLKDNGNGISDIKKVMTPYYTTKSKGTGLGLPIVSKIVNEHSGEISIKNNKTEGVNIEIFFPYTNK